MSHSAEESKPEKKQRFYYKFTPFERMVVIVLAFAVVGMVAQGIIQRSTNAAQDARTIQVAKEARQCLADRLDALHDYLDARGEIADRDRINENRDDVADNRVLRSFVEAARTGNNATAIRELERWEEAQKEIVAEEKAIEEDRNEKPLPEFPGGDCLGQGDASPNDRATNEPADEPTEEPTDDNSSSPSIGSGSTGGSATSTGSPRANGSGSSGPARGGSGGGGGGEGGSPPSGPPDNNSSSEPPIVDLDLNIPDLLSVAIPESGPPVITPEPGGILDPEGIQ